MLKYFNWDKKDMTWQYKWKPRSERREQVCIVLKYLLINLLSIYQTSIPYKTHLIVSGDYENDMVPTLKELEI